MSSQDQAEKRKMQVRNAQRRFRAKQKEQEEKEKREAQNQERAASAYTSYNPDQVQNKSDLSGLPWGGWPLHHMVQGQSKDSDASQQGSSQGQSSNTSTTSSG